MTTTTRDLAPAAARPTLITAVKNAGRSLRALAAIWRRRLGERALLAQMDEREIRDLGISTSDVMMEINKPFWRG